MTTTEIKQQLCIYDKRNPYYHEDDIQVKHKNGTCSCDTCYLGKSELANELLRVKEQNIEPLLHIRNEIRSLTRVADKEANELLNYIESYLL